MNLLKLDEHMEWMIEELDCRWWEIEVSLVEGDVRLERGPLGLVRSPHV